MGKKAISTLVWFIPLLPIALASTIYLGEIQSTSFIFINSFTQLLPDTLWAWLTFFGNGWGIFAMAFPLLLIAPRLLTAGITPTILLFNFTTLPNCKLLCDG